MVNVDVERPGAHTSNRDDLITAGLAAWLMVGLFVDGWAHINLAQLETFFTPWHGLFYSGFTATAIWIATLVGRGHVGDRSWRQAVPVGYEAGVVGLAAFAVGGIGDWAWHSMFGIEETLDALLSPTHLLLFLGMLLIVTSPLRAVWHRHPGRNIGTVEFRPALLSMSLLTMVTSFFLLYAWAPSSSILTVPFSPSDGQSLAALGVLFLLANTVVLTGVALLLIQRWDVPRGAFTSLFGMLGVLMAGLEGFDPLFATAPPLLTGVAVDLAVARMRPGPERRVALRLTAGIVPFVFVGSDVAVWALFSRLGWSPELWAGAIVEATLLGVGMSYLAVPYGEATQPTA